MGRLLRVMVIGLAVSCNDGVSPFTRAACHLADPDRLAPGESMELFPERVQGEGCYAISTPGGRYALVWYDTRSLTDAASGLEPGWEYTLPWTMSYSSGQPWGRPPQARLTRDGDVVAADFSESSGMLSQLDGTPWTRTTPWSVGEQFVVQVYPPSAQLIAEVLRIYDGRFVVARLVGDTARLVPAMLAALDTAMPVVRDVAEPLLQSSLTATRPRTSRGSDQALIILADNLSGFEGFSGHAIARRDGAEVFGWIVLRLDSLLLAAPRLGSLVAHEVAHLYQRQFMHETRPPKVVESGFGTSFWGVESGANLASIEVLRRVTGIGLLSNHDWRGATTDPWAAVYGQRAPPASGMILRGYDHGVGVLRDFVLRRVASGESPEEALREVSRGAIEGWYGNDWYGWRRVGLVARMRERLGRGWEPADAVLTFALSHVGDDRTPNPDYQNPASLRVWDTGPGAPGWIPTFDVSSDEPFEGTSVRQYGSVGFAYLTDRGEGLNFSLGASVPGVRWMVLRIE